MLRVAQQNYASWTALRLSLLICNPQGYSRKSNPDKKKEDVFTCKLIKTIFASFYNYFAVSAALKLFLSARAKHVSFQKIVSHHLSVFPSHLEFQSHILRGLGGPRGQALQQMSTNISPHCSLTKRVLKSLLWRHSGMVLWCWNDSFVLKISLQLTLLQEQALLVGSQVCMSLRSVLTLSLHYFSTGGKWMQRRQKKTSIEDKYQAIIVCKWKRPLRDHTNMGVGLHEARKKYKTHLAIKKNEKQVKFHLHVWVLLLMSISSGRNQPLKPCALENPQLTVS